LVRKLVRKLGFLKKAATGLSWIRDEKQQAGLFKARRALRQAGKLANILDVREVRDGP
jgi:hypothetical protein